MDVTWCTHRIQFCSSLVTRSSCKMDIKGCKVDVKGCKVDVKGYKVDAKVRTYRMQFCSSLVTLSSCSSLILKIQSPIMRSYDSFCHSMLCISLRASFTCPPQPLDQHPRSYMSTAVRSTSPIMRSYMSYTRVPRRRLPSDGQSEPPTGVRWTLQRSSRSLVRAPPGFWGKCPRGNLAPPLELQ